MACASFVKEGQWAAWLFFLIIVLGLVCLFVFFFFSFFGEILSTCCLFSFYCGDFVLEIGGLNEVESKVFISMLHTTQFDASFNPSTKLCHCSLCAKTF